MKDWGFSILFLSAFFFSSCQNQTTTKQNVDIVQPIKAKINQDPNYNYVVEIPAGFTSRDTIMLDGLRIRLLLPPKSLYADYPAVNILIASMEGRKTDDFTVRNINYLKSNMPNVTILERGNIGSEYSGQWFTYTKDQDGIIRDMINYIIPLNDFAYMITCGTNKGSMNKYRRIFDKIAKSFKG